MPDDKDLQKSLDRAARTPRTTRTSRGKLAEDVEDDGFGSGDLPPPLPAPTTPPAHPPERSPLAPNLAARLRPTAHKQAPGIGPIEDAFPYPVAFRLAFLGAGQGGGRIANEFWNLGYRRVGAFNTTDQDFDGLDPEIPLLSLEIGGAGKDMNRARKAAAASTEEIRDLMTRAWGADPDCVLICASLGGGTGSGTVSLLAQEARKYMQDRGRPARVGAVVSLPSTEDGQMIARNAVTAFNELLAAKLSPILVIDNDRVHTLYQPSMDQLLPRANELVTNLFHLFNQHAAQRSKHATFDKSEFLQLLDGGMLAMGAVTLDEANIRSPSDVSSAIRDQLSESVLAQVDIRTGRKGACLFICGKQILSKFSRDYFSAGFTMLDRLVGSLRTDAEDPVVIHRGIYESDDPDLQCYVMVSGLAAPKDRLAELARKGGVSPSATSSLAQHLRVE